MRRLYFLVVFAASVSAQPFTGRWDLTITTPKDTYPSWMEFKALNDVRVVGRVASAHPATEVKVEGSHLSFTTSEWFGKQIKVTWDMTVKGGKIAGIQKREDGVSGQIAGVPAPALNRKPPAAWTPDEVVEFMLTSMGKGDFYILCPDNDVPRELDERRILWAAGDIVENRPPLSRWHPAYKDAFAKFAKA